MASVHDQIINNQNLNTITKITQERLNGKQSSNTVNSQDFLQLLTMQLQYQDPMNPMDNSEMLAQEAQFSTLKQMEALSNSFSKFSTAFQANSLLGQTVEVVVDGKASSGKVDYVDFSDSKGASVSINGRNYPLDAVTKVYPSDGSIPTTNNEGNMTADEKNFFLTAVDYIADNIGTILNTIQSGLSAYNSNNNTSQTNN